MTVWVAGGRHQGAANRGSSVSRARHRIVAIMRAVSARLVRLKTIASLPSPPSASRGWLVMLELCHQESYFQRSRRSPSHRLGESSSSAPRQRTRARVIVPMANRQLAISNLVTHRCDSWCVAKFKHYGKPTCSDGGGACADCDFCIDPPPSPPTPPPPPPPCVSIP